MNSPYLPPRSHAGWILFLLVLSLVALECIEAPLSPLMPSFDTQLTIPLVDRLNYVVDMFSKDTTKVKSNAQGYYFVDNQAANPTGIDSIKVTPQANSNQVTVGRVTVPGLGNVSQSFTISSMGISPQAIPNGFPFPASSASFPGTSFDQTALFDFVQVDTGSVSLSITNNLPVRISFPQPIALKNNQTIAPVDTNVVASFSFPVIDSFTTVTVTSPLAGKLMRGKIKTNSVTFNTAARTGPFQITTSNGISFGFTSGQLLVDSASAVIPSQQVVAINDSIITIDPTAVLQQARFSRGQFNVTLTNNLGITVGVFLKFSNFVSALPSQDTLIINQTMAPHSTFPLNVRLDTVQLINGSPAATGTTMRFSVGINTITSSGVKSTVTLNDFVRASFTPQQTFVVKSVTGKINPLTVPINSGVSVASLGEADKFFSGSFVYDSVIIKLRFALSSGYPISHNLKLFARSHLGKVDSLPIPPGIIFPGFTTPGEITLDNSAGLNVFLSRITPNLPDSLYIRGAVVVNPSSASGTISDTTKIYPSLSTRIPLKIGISGSFANTYAIQSAIDTTTARMTNKATIRFEITNHLPIGITFGGAFVGFRNGASGPRDTVLLVPTTGGPLSIAAATVDANGNTNAPVISRFNISLLNPDMLNFRRADSLRILVNMLTGGGGTQAVRIQSSDYIRIRAFGNLALTVNK